MSDIKTVLEALDRAPSLEDGMDIRYIAHDDLAKFGDWQHMLALLIERHWGDESGWQAATLNADYVEGTATEDFDTSWVSTSTKTYVVEHAAQLLELSLDEARAHLLSMFTVTLAYGTEVAPLLRERAEVAVDAVISWLGPDAVWLSNAQAVVHLEGDDGWSVASTGFTKATFDRVAVGHSSRGVFVAVVEDED